MTEIQKAVLTLIRSALTGNKERVPEGTDWKSVYVLGKKHQILPVLYHGASNCQVVLEESLKHSMKSAVAKCILIAHTQQQEADALFQSFEENGIAYMPLKGIILKERYPSPEMRPMGDMDILINVDQYEKIRQIMTQQGFHAQYETDHELTWNKGMVCVELHKRVIPSYNQEYYAYFGDGWKLGHPREENAFRYEMTREDEYVFLFTHMAKHYRDGGIGIRHFVDLYLCYRDLNLSYIQQELKKLRLWDFFSNVRSTLQVWFDGAQPTEMTDYITNFVFSSGVYGNAENKAAAVGARLNSRGRRGVLAKVKRIWKLTFLSYKNMCYKYSILKKWPVLLPVMWVARWGDVLVNKREKIRRHYREINTMTPDKIENFRQSMEYVQLPTNRSIQ